MKAKHFINLHKGLSFPFIFTLMLIYQNFNLGAWVYLALHGTYGLLWLLKSQIYPDKQWEQEISVGMGIFGFVLVSLYWVAPFILISSGSQPPLPLVGAAISLNIIGVFLHYTADAQKYYTLKYHSGLITEGFFARSRNTNYLGEILIYGSFAMLVQHWLPFLILASFIAGMFIPNMIKKERSLGRYPEFADYKTRSGFLLPRLFVSTPLEQKKDSLEEKAG
jgi:protein-S-isoprenylcysteine O-methyltransferase Ste14